MAGIRSIKTIFIGNTGNTPLGDLWVAVSEYGLVAVEFPTTLAEFSAWLQKKHSADVKFAPKKVSEFVAQLRDYAAGRGKEFTFPIDWSVLGKFQRATLQATFAIPYGETRTYKDIAVQIGAPRAARAVGRAEATNPMPLVLPCHRVLGSDGRLHGYGAGAGLETKTWLLKLEGAVLS
jgi:methylated-DNA-[protein]-cysteine S-methyltransferase